MTMAKTEVSASGYKSENTLSYGFFAPILLCILFAIIIFTVFARGNYLITGNAHDLFIPLNSAYAIDQGLQFHTQYHSPFGPVYHVLNYLGYAAAETWPQTFYYLDAILLTSVVTFAVILALVAVIKRTLPDSACITMWMILILFTLMFQVRDPSAFGGVSLLWYGLYNHQNWAFLLLQVMHCVAFVQRPRTRRETVAYALIQAFFLLFAMNFKVSFFAASGLVCLAPLALMPARRIGEYLATGLAAVSLVTLAVTMAGYDYVGLLRDNILAIEARSTGIAVYPSYATAIAGLALFIVGAQVLRFQGGHAVEPREDFRAFMTAFWVQGVWKYMNKRDLAFDVLLGLALFASAAGEFQRPWVYSAIALWLLPYHKATPLHRRGLFSLMLAAIVVGFVALNFQSTLMVMQRPSASTQSKIDKFASLRTVEIQSAGAPFTMTVGNGRPVSEFKEGRGEGEIFILGPDYKERLLRASYNFLTESGYRPAVPVHNVQYTESLNEVVGILKSAGAKFGGDDLIETLAFINPFPVLMQTPTPTPSHHWIHIGTTIAPWHIPEIIENMGRSDFIVVPVRDQSPLFDRVFMNCEFYIWNFAHDEPFLGIGVGGGFLVFASRPVARRSGLSEAFHLDPQSVNESCTSAFGDKYASR